LGEDKINRGLRGFVADYADSLRLLPRNIWRA